MQKNKKYFKFRRFFPNFITILALCTGFSSIQFALKDMWEQSINCIVIAAFLDGLDGRVARFMKCTSEIGAELDSLVDLINFGASTAIIMYLYTLSELNQFGWAASLIFVASMALRLARFNSYIKNHGPYLVGVPAPFGGIIGLMPITYSIVFETKISPFFGMISLILSSILMISTIPTLSLKKINVPKRFLFPLIIILISLFCTSLYNRWITLLIISIGYVISIPITFILGRKHINKNTKIVL